MSKARKGHALRAKSIGRSVLALAMILATLFGTGCAELEALLGGGTEQEGPRAYPEGYQEQFRQVWRENNDFMGYLSLDGTPLNSPVVQAADNRYYANRGFDGAEQGSVPFLDHRVNMASPSANLVIYTPDANTDEAFGELNNYKSLDYYKEHPVLNFNSVYGDAQYKIFGIVMAEEGDPTLPYQDYINPYTDVAIPTLALDVRLRSLMNLPVDVADGDELITVCTTDESLRDADGNPARMLLFGRKVREGEDPAVDVNQAAMNTDAILPENWREALLGQRGSTRPSKEIRDEAAQWFTTAELAAMDESELEWRLNERKALYTPYLTEEELELPPAEKTYLYLERSGQLEEALKMGYDRYLAALEADKPQDSGGSGGSGGSGSGSGGSGGSGATLTVSPRSVTMEVGDTANLTATLSGGDDSAFSWRSSNNQVVAVNGSGDRATLTARGAGTATITVSADGQTATSSVTVSGGEGLTLNPTSLTMMVGEQQTVAASVNVKGAESSNPSVATVTATGRNVSISAVGKGTATITVTGEDGEEAECEVTVVEDMITLNPTEMLVSVGQLATITATVGNVEEWAVTDPSLLEILPVGTGNVLQITGKAPGICTVTAKSATGFTATCRVEINPEPNDLEIYPEAIFLMEEFYTTSTITVIRGDPATVEWTTSDESIVYVNKTDTGAEVSGLKLGTAYVTATAPSGATATCQVTVQAFIPNLGYVVKLLDEYPQVSTPVPRPPEDPNYPGYSVTMEKHQQFEIDVTDGDATLWLSSNDAIAAVMWDEAVTETATVRGMDPGDAVISLKNANGRTLTCDVTVEPLIFLSERSVFGSIEKDAENSYHIEKLDTGTFTMDGGDILNITITDSEGGTVTASRAPKSSPDTFTVTGSSSIVTLLKPDDLREFSFTADAVGSFTVTVDSENELTTSCTVTVPDLTLDPAPLTVEQNHSATITVDGGDIREVTCTDTAEEFVKVTWSGRTITVTGVKPNLDVPVSITVTTVNNLTPATCEITVTRPELKIYPTELVLDIGGEPGTIKITNGGNVDPGGVVSSSDDFTASVDITAPREITVIAPQQPGKATITITDEYGSTVTCQVTAAHPLKLFEEDGLTPLQPPPPQVAQITVQDGLDYRIIVTGAAVSTVTSDEPLIAAGRPTGNDMVTILGVDPGTATITITDEHRRTIKLQVTVTAAP